MAEDLQYLSQALQNCGMCRESLEFVSGICVMSFVQGVGLALQWLEDNGLRT